MPRKYSDSQKRKIFDAIIEDIGNGSLVTAACQKPGRISVPTLFDWLSLSDNAENKEDIHFGMSERYARAMEARNQIREDEIRQEAQSVRAGVIEEYEYETVRAYLLDSKGKPKLDAKGEELLDPEHPSGWKMVETSKRIRRVDAVDRSRLAVDTAKWLLAKSQPRPRGTGRFGYGNDPASQLNIQQGDIQAGGTGFTINLINSPDTE